MLQIMNLVIIFHRMRSSRDSLRKHNWYSLQKTDCSRPSSAVPVKRRALKNRSN